MDNPCFVEEEKNFLIQKKKNSKKIKSKINNRQRWWYITTTEIIIDFAGNFSFHPITKITFFFGQKNQKSNGHPHHQKVLSTSSSSVCLFVSLYDEGEKKRMKRNLTETGEREEKSYIVIHSFRHLAKEKEKDKTKYLLFRHSLHLQKKKMQPEKKSS